MNIWVRILPEQEVGIMIIRRHTTHTQAQVYIPINSSNFPT